MSGPLCRIPHVSLARSAVMPACHWKTADRTDRTAPRPRSLARPPLEKEDATSLEGTKRTSELANGGKILDCFCRMDGWESEKQTHSAIAVTAKPTGPRESSLALCKCGKPKNDRFVSHAASTKEPRASNNRVVSGWHLFISPPPQAVSVRRRSSFISLKLQFLRRTYKPKFRLLSSGPLHRRTRTYAIIISSLVPSTPRPSRLYPLPLSERIAGRATLPRRGARFACLISLRRVSGRIAE